MSNNPTPNTEGTTNSDAAEGTKRGLSGTQLGAGKREAKNAGGSLEADASTSSRSLDMGGADRLSGFFTPVWEKSRHGNPPSGGSTRATGGNPSESDSKRSVATDGSQAKVDATTGSRKTASDGQLATSLKAKQPHPVSGTPLDRKPSLSTSAGASSSIETPPASVLLRRLRRTLRLYTPLPDGMRQTVETHRLRN